MSETGSIRDVIFLLADRNMEAAVSGLVERHQALSIHQISFVIRVHPQKDPGCCLRAHDFLRAFCRRYSYAIVIFDREGCGREEISRTEIEREVESRLASSGWPDGRARAIVIDPELEAWVWSDSPRVDHVLGWGDRTPSVREWLDTQEFKILDNGKPERPKEAVEAVLRDVRKARSSAIYRELANQVSLRRCVDPAFNKLTATLRNWFPAT